MAEPPEETVEVEETFTETRRVKVSRPSDDGVTLVRGGVSPTRRRVPDRKVLLGGAAALVVVAGAAVALTQVGGDDDGDGGGEDNGVAEKSIGEIGAEVDAAMNGLTSVRIVIAPTGGEDAFSLDLRVDDAGECEGTYEAQGVEATVLSVDDRFFYRPSANYWETSGLDAATAATLQELVGDRWIDGSETAGVSSLGTLCSGGVEALTSDAYDATAFEQDGWTVGEEDEVDGRPAVRLEREDDDAGSAVTLWVATTGEPYVLRADVAEGETSASYTLSEQDEPLGLEVPAPEEIVPPEELVAAVGDGATAPPG
ncbi:hypothetical protein INN71_13670 [Nocardioides sp. ChNu-153]|uniref:hypothetical protein n=1 Tax=unclassified Nocardioides TaxID=2615069 RepID=UPI002405F3E1|nr:MULTISPECIES: hypothetical protein [unclassified Nocardioides]MDF9714968.1 hypothetical protein [Nocardioides sp. ChNu-99]MDN7122435.1 hypothetical protein [Nocardioides sp. ChNu-153]